MSDTRWLSEAELQAWLGYHRMRLRLDALVARDLADDSGLSMPDYDVLSALEAAPDHRVRVGALAARMLWSQSRLSRHLGRMETRELVTRERCDDDGRGATVVLTAAGLHAIQQAAPGHVASVRAHIIDLLSAEQLTALASIADTVLDHLNTVRPLPALPGDDQRS